MTFDELFYDFFSDRKEFKNDEELDGKIDQITDFIKKNMKFNDNEIDNNSKLIKVEKIKIDGVDYEKSTWDLNGTILVKLAISNEEPNLYDLLHKAIDDENYEEAARLRDLINEK
jgi:hypothetical protein